MAAGNQLTQAELDFLAVARTAVLGTLAPDGRPRLVPVCFVFLDGRIYSPLDEKPKRVDDPRDLARVRDLLANPASTLLIDHWSEDWSRLGWLRIDCRGELIEPDRRPGHGDAVVALRAKYPQYAGQRLEGRPMIRLTVERARSWGNLAAD